MCNECDGTGLVEGTDYISVGNAQIASNYARMIASLDAEIEIARYPTQAMYFRFDGGDGMVMPVMT